MQTGTRNDKTNQEKTGQTEMNKQTGRQTSKQVDRQASSQSDKETKRIERHISRQTRRSQTNRKNAYILTPWQKSKKSNRETDCESYGQTSSDTLPLWTSAEDRAELLKDMQIPLCFQVALSEMRAPSSVTDGIIGDRHLLEQLQEAHFNIWFAMQGAEDVVRTRTGMRPGNP